MSDNEEGDTTQVPEDNLARHFLHDSIVLSGEACKGDPKAARGILEPLACEDIVHVARGIVWSYIEYPATSPSGDEGGDDASATTTPHVERDEQDDGEEELPLPLLAVSSLRLIWGSDVSPRDNMSVGFGCIKSITAIRNKKEKENKAKKKKSSTRGEKSSSIVAVDVLVQSCGIEIVNSSFEADACPSEPYYLRFRVVQSLVVAAAAAATDEKAAATADTVMLERLFDALTAALGSYRAVPLLNQVVIDRNFNIEEEGSGNGHHGPRPKIEDTLKSYGGGDGCADSAAEATTTTTTISVTAISHGWQWESVLYEDPETALVRHEQNNTRGTLEITTMRIVYIVNGGSSSRSGTTSSHHRLYSIPIMKLARADLVDSTKLVVCTGPFHGNFTLQIAFSTEAAAAEAHQLVVDSFKQFGSLRMTRANLEMVLGFTEENARSGHALLPEEQRVSEAELEEGITQFTRALLMALGDPCDFSLDNILAQMPPESTPAQMARVKALGKSWKQSMLTDAARHTKTERESVPNCDAFKDWLERVEEDHDGRQRRRRVRCILPYHGGDPIEYAFGMMRFDIAPEQLELAAPYEVELAKFSHLLDLKDANSPPCALSITNFRVRVLGVDSAEKNISIGLHVIKNVECEPLDANDEDSPHCLKIEAEQTGMKMCFLFQQSTTTETSSTSSIAGKLAASDPPSEKEEEDLPSPPKSTTGASIRSSAASTPTRAAPPSKEEGKLRSGKDDAKLKHSPRPPPPAASSSKKPHASEKNKKGKKKDDEAERVKQVNTSVTQVSKEVVTTTSSSDGPTSGTSTTSASSSTSSNNIPRQILAAIDSAINAYSKNMENRLLRTVVRSGSAAEFAEVAGVRTSWEQLVKEYRCANIKGDSILPGRFRLTTRRLIYEYIPNEGKDDEGWCVSLPYHQLSRVKTSTRAGTKPPAEDVEEEWRASELVVIVNTLEAGFSDPFPLSDAHIGFVLQTTEECREVVASVRELKKKGKRDLLLSNSQLI